MDEKVMEIDLKALVNIFRKRWAWIAASTVAGFLILLMVSLFMLPRKYTSSVSLYVNNLTSVSLTGDVNINDINASQKLVDTYIVILQDDDVLQQVADELSTPMTAKELSGAISMQSVNQTEVLQISAETVSPELSAEICNTLAAVAPSVLQRVVKAGSVEVIGAAKVPQNPSSPNVKRNALLGALIGLVLSVGASIMIYLLDNTVKGEEDLKNRLDVPVLGEIPSFDHVTRRGHHVRAK